MNNARHCPGRRSTFLCSALICLALLLVPMVALAGTVAAPNGSAQGSIQVNLKMPTTVAPLGVVTDWNATFVENAGPSGTVAAFAIWDDGAGEALYVGGRSSSGNGLLYAAGGIEVNWIGRWNGVSWSALGSGLNGAVTAMVPFGDELIVAGNFTMAGGMPVRGIARWNGSRWAGYDLNLHSTGPLIIYQGQLIAAGYITRANGTADWTVARWLGQSMGRVGDGLRATGVGTGGP